MRLMKRISRALTSLAMLGWVLVAAQTADADLAVGLRLLEEGRTTLDEAALNEAGKYFDKLKEKAPGNAIYLYELARVDFYRCNGLDARGDKKAALAALEKAIDEAQQALRLNERSAEAHSLMADLYGRKIGFGGFMAGVHFGPKAAAENKRALELDSNSPRVDASIGRQYLESPKMFGGDVDKAIASFQKSLQREPTNDETLVWLALAYHRKGDAAAEKKAIDEALRLNPRSLFARNIKAGKGNVR
jgi:tetratricopeptide (TPR) repeat protein